MENTTRDKKFKSILHADIHFFDCIARSDEHVSRNRMWGRRDKKRNFNIFYRYFKGLRRLSCNECNGMCVGIGKGDENGLFECFFSWRKNCFRQVSGDPVDPFNKGNSRKKRAEKSFNG